MSENLFKTFKVPCFIPRLKLYLVTSTIIMACDDMAYKLVVEWLGLEKGVQLRSMSYLTR